MRAFADAEKCEKTLMTLFLRKCINRRSLYREFGAFEMRSVQILIYSLLFMTFLHIHFVFVPTKATNRHELR